MRVLDTVITTQGKAGVLMRVLATQWLAKARPTANEDAEQTQRSPAAGEACMTHWAT